VAVTTTPLGFQKPDGGDAVRNGDNIMSANAQKAQDLHASSLTRIGLAEAALNAGAGGPGLSADPINAGLYFFAGPTIAPDPGHPGFYLIGA
jgi:hypothetical protein